MDQKYLQYVVSGAELAGIHAALESAEGSAVVQALREAAASKAAEVEALYQSWREQSA